MASTILQEVLGVRQMLSGPLSQSPSFQDILEELEAEYQFVTGDTNNTANAWQVATTTITTEADVDDYPICANDFYKALSVVTVPANTATQPEYQLEFVELEHINKDWAWLGTGKGQYMYSSHDSQLIAFYHKITNGGEEVRVQLRPMPSQAQEYKILYQVTDWWPRVTMEDVRPCNSCGSSSGCGCVPVPDGFRMPHSSQRFYTRALAAQNLLLSGKVRWSSDPVKDFTKGKLISDGLAVRIARYKKVYDEYIDSLDQPDITLISSWADDNVFQLG